MEDLFIGALSLVCGLIIGIIGGFELANMDSIKSDHPLTPHKEIKVDSNGDSTITYIYKLDE